MAWTRLCAVDDVPPGEMRAFTVDGIDLLLVRGPESFLVIPPSCPHMLNPLAEGMFDGEVLTCTKHLWQWSVRDAQPMGLAEAPLLAYEAEMRGAAIWVNLQQPLKYPHEA